MSKEVIRAPDSQAPFRGDKTRGLVGSALLDVFPDNPNEPAATGVRNQHTSLNRVLANRAPNKMLIDKYDVRSPADGRTIRAALLDSS
jgi:hypothetical protein